MLATGCELDGNPLATRCQTAVDQDTPCADVEQVLRGGDRVRCTEESQGEVTFEDNRDPLPERAYRIIVSSIKSLSIRSIHGPTR
jgi:hypothetical protein